MIKNRAHLLLLALFPLLVLIVFLWRYHAPVESELNVPIAVVNLSADLIVTGQPPKEVEIVVQGQKTALASFRTQKLACTLDLADVNAGLTTLPVGASNLLLPAGITIVHIEPTSITLRIEPKLTKTVPVSITLADTPARGYRVELAQATPPTLQISGPEKIIAPIEQLATLPVSTREMADSFKKEVAVELPSEVTIGNGGTALITAQVEIAENVITRRFDNIPVAVRNTVLPVKITPPEMDIDVKGPETVLANLSSDTDIKAYIDLKALSPGVYVRRSQITLPVGTTLAGADPEVFTVVIGQ